MGQGFIQYASGDTTVRAGRQELIFDNARFVGNVGWRQHHQTFDAINVSNESVAGATFRYAYVDRVHRIFGDRQDIDGHLLNVNVDVGALYCRGLAQSVALKRLALKPCAQITCPGASVLKRFAPAHFFESICPGVFALEQVAPKPCVETICPKALV